MKGFSLIEMMVALLLSLLSLSALLEMYATSQRNLLLQSQMQAVSENAQAASYLIMTEIHRAGYIGCARLTPDFPMHGVGPFNLTPTNKLIAESNRFTVKYAATPEAELVRPMSDDLNLTVNETVRFTAGDWVVISDCQHAEIFRVQQAASNHHQQYLVASAPLQNQYDQHARISHFVSQTYYIAKTGRIDRHHQPIYALFSESGDGSKWERVAGVQAMEFAVTVRREGQWLVLPPDAIQEGEHVIAINATLSLYQEGLRSKWPVFAALRG